MNVNNWRNRHIASTLEHESFTEIMEQLNLSFNQGADVLT